MLMGVVDALMVGRISPAALAATALGNFYWIMAVVGGQGVIMALDPVIAQAVGARDDEAVARGVQRGLVLAVVLSVLTSLALFPAGPVLRALGQPDDVIPGAAAFIRASIPGLLPYFVFVAFRQALQAFAALRPILIAVVVGNLCNVALNYLLIFGNAGFPAMGVVGSSIASTISRWVMMLTLGVLAWRLLRPYVVPLRAQVFDAAPIARMLRLGVPIGIHMVLEVGSFGIILLLMGWLGTIPLAAHEITITLASLTYMVPLGTASAAAVLVGHAIGRGDAEGARREASAALVCGVGFMALTAVAFLAFPMALARLFTDAPSVLAISVALIPVAGVFQIFDGVQGVSSGILRGCGDTRIPMIMNFVGFIMIGVPLGAWLGLGTRLGPAGLWWGLVAGLVVVAITLALRVRNRLGGDLSRIHIDLPTLEHPPEADPAIFPR